MPFLVLIAIIICGVIYAKKYSRESFQSNVNFCFDCRKTNARLEQLIMTSYLWDGKEFQDAISATQQDIVRLGFVPCIPPDAYGVRRYSHDLSLGGVTHNFELRQDPRCTNTISNVTSYVEDVHAYDSKAVKTRLETYKQRWTVMHPDQDVWEMPEPIWSDLYRNFPSTQKQLSQEDMRCSQWGYAAPVGSYFMHGLYGMCEVVGYDEPPLGKSLCYRVKVLSSGSVVGGIHFNDSTIKKIRVNR